MPFLYDRAFDYNDQVFQTRALVNNYPQKVKGTPADITADTNGFEIDDVAAGAGVGAGHMHVSPLTTEALEGTIILTAIVAGGDVAQVGVGTEVTGLTTVDLDDTGNNIEDNNGGSSTDFITAGFVANEYVKVNGATVSNNLKWNGYYRISSITSANGGTNNVLNLNSTDIVGTPGDHTAQSGVVLTPIGAGGAFTVSGTAGVSGLLVAGQRFVRDHYLIAVDTTTNWSITTNADRVTMTMTDGAATAKHVHSPAQFDFLTTADTIVDDTPNDLLDQGFRVGGGVLVRNANTGANDGLKVITAIDDDTGTNNRLTVLENLTTDANDTTAELIPMNATVTLTPIVNFVVSGNKVYRTDDQAWSSDGFFPGDYVVITNAATGANDDTFKILRLSDTAQRNDTLELDAAVSADTADTITITGYFVPERFGDQKFSLANDGLETTLRDEPYMITGEEPPHEEGDGNFNVQWNWESPGLLFGQGVSDRIFGGMKTFFNEAATRFNINVMTSDGFVSSSVFDSQPNKARRTVLSETNSYPYASVFNGEHVRGFARILGSNDQSWYTGFGELLAAKGQHPYPMLCGGMHVDQNAIPSNAEEDHRAWWDPASDGAAQASSALFQQVAGTYQTITHSESASSYQPDALLKAMWWTPYVSQINRGTVEPQWNFHSMVLRLRRTLSDEYQLLPLELFDNSPASPYIKPYGVFFISGEANAGLNTTVVGGITHVVIQNRGLTANNNYCAYALD